MTAAARSIRDSVRIFLAEKGISIPTEQVDIATQQHRTETFAAINPMRRLPVLVLDDGTVIAESIAICRDLRRYSPIRRCSAAARWKSRWWKCGTGGPSSISWGR